MPPLPSSSRSLFGLEKAVPPEGFIEQLSTRSYSSTPYLFSSDTSKPLPHSPSRKTSSVYSGGSSYTNIIQSYADADEEELPMPSIEQPQAYSDTTAAVLQHNYQTNLALELNRASFRCPRYTRSIPSLLLTRQQSPALSLIETPLEGKPSFADIPCKSRNHKHNAISPVSSDPSPNINSHSAGLLSRSLSSSGNKYRLSYDHDHRFLPGPMSDTTNTDNVDAEMRPPSLDLERTRKVRNLRVLQSRAVEEHQIKPSRLIDIQEAQQRALQERKEREIELIDSFGPQRRAAWERQSSPSYLIDLKEAQRIEREKRKKDWHGSESSDDFIIYTGFRESVKSMIQEAVRTRKGERQREKERKLVLSVAGEKYPGMRTSPKSEEHDFLWASSRTSSVHQRVNSLFRRLSISGSRGSQRGREEERGRPRERGRRQKQLAIPTTPYQKYGVEVWYAKNKKKRKEQIAPQTPPRQVDARSIPRPQQGHKRLQETTHAFQSGWNQLFDVMEGTKQALSRENLQERREHLKQSIAMVGPAQLGQEEVGDNWV